MKRYRLCIIIGFVLLTFIACTNSNGTATVDMPEFVSKNGFHLDTIIEMKIYDPNEDSEAILEEGIERIDELEQLLSIHVEGSDLSNIAKNAGIKPVKVADETFELIEKSIYYSESSNGQFDITAGPLIELWAINPPEGHIPTDEELAEALSKVDYKKIVLNKDENTIYLEEESMVANLGAIAKGYIADEVKEVLTENNVKSATINLGGNVLLVGGKPDGGDFRIGIQDPESDRGLYIGTISASDISIVSSGDYERYFEKDGKMYHHILDPHTGYPSDNEITQVTILSDLSVDGDALSTTTFLLGLEKGLAYVESLNDVEAIFVTKDYEIYTTSGVDDEFTFDEGNYGNKYTIID